MARLLDSLPVWAVLAACATLGLAPFTPEPHVWEKLRMLAAGELRAAVDWFDLALHGAPWLLLAAKGLRWFSRKSP
ncbi:RND transporter [Roseovarius salis]|uniref:RND transporter n=1 Tax=Roseovarius salis TaxID=3376063 RepID=UPI0037C76FE6